MAGCKNTESIGSNNPLQDKVVPADYTNNITGGDNTLYAVTCDSSVNSKVVGIVSTKPTSTTCDIITTGPTGTILAGLTPDTTYFLSASTAGALTSTVPSSTGDIVLQIGNATSSNSLIIQIGIQIRRG